MASIGPFPGTTPRHSHGVVGSCVVALLLALALFTNRGDLLAHAGPFVAGWLALHTVAHLVARRRNWGWPGLLQAVTGAMTLVAWCAAAGDRQAAVLHLIQLAVVWLPVLGVAYSPEWTRAWRKVLLATASAALTLGAVSLAGPLIVRNVFLTRYVTDVDHHPLPLTGIYNGDGVQPDKPASAYGEDDFVIVFMGDSFTAGDHLDNTRDGFAFRIERELRRTHRELSVRVVNFGWISSSPLLQLRQLQMIGPKYHPDLVVQAFDMTDFGDDLYYGELLANLDARSSRRVTLWGIAVKKLSAALGVHDLRCWMWSNLAGQPFQPRRCKPRDQGRFFYLEQPLEQSEPQLQFTWNVLTDTHEYASELGAAYVLLILPRYQQYNPAECPDDWEGDFPDRSPHLLAPFEFFDQQAATAPFPVHSLLEVFRDCGEYPTTFPDDPHYNETGHRIAAEAILGFLEGDGVLQ